MDVESGCIGEAGVPGGDGVFGWHDGEMAIPPVVWRRIGGVLRDVSEVLGEGFPIYYLDGYDDGVEGIEHLESCFDNTCRGDCSDGPEGEELRGSVNGAGSGINVWRRVGGVLKAAGDSDLDDGRPRYNLNEVVVDVVEHTHICEDDCYGGECVVESCRE